MHTTTFRFLDIIFFVFILNLSLHSQENNTIFEAYENYVEAPREVVYLHLNKSTYVKGESIGFTAYVLDKKEKTPSLITTNLYISISDENNKQIKQQLVKVNNGVDSNVIAVDSLFSSGFYNVKAYTNYMRNFDEPNFYSEAIKIIDPEVESYVKKSLVENDIDAQFLPESGHLLHGVMNNIGVVIKDSQGFGLPEASGEVVSNNGEVITTFKTNKLGIGKFPLFADINSTYTVKIKHANKDFSFPLGHSVARNGVVLNVRHLKNKLFASVVTNQETLALIQNKRYTLMLHNGDGYEIMDIYFTDNTVVTKAIEYANIPVGTNINTLFNENETPVAERLFFNYNGINKLTSNTINTTKELDSVSVQLKYRDIDPNIFNNISVSVLPKESESYNRHNSIISQTYLQPYIKGAIEYAKYYFSNVDEKKKYDLDNLLLTQGWSSYDWNNLFIPEKLKFPFEQGILLKANINNPDHLEDVYVLHHFKDNAPQYKQSSDNGNSFIFDRIFPEESDEILLSRVEDNKKMLPAQLYIQSFPNHIPSLSNNYKTLKPKTSYKISESLKNTNPILLNFDNVQELAEVVIEAEFEDIKTKTERVGRSVFGIVKEVNDIDKLTYQFLEDFLLTYRVQSIYNAESDNMVYLNGRASGSILGGGGMQVFFDDVPITSTGFLYQFPIANVDYVEINRDGSGEGARGANGTLRIYSDFESIFRGRQDQTTQDIELPLTFSKKKTYYAPKYASYNSEFYRGYGTIDWKPELHTNAEGIVSFKITTPEIPFTLFIEGIANNGQFISEEKSISLN